MTTYAQRIANELNSFATASLLLNTVSRISGSWTRATLTEDRQQATDLHWLQYSIAVRDRMMTEEEFGKYRDEITIRATGELDKLNTFPVDAIVYIRRRADHQLLGYSIVSVSKLRVYLSGYDLKRDDWWKQTNGAVVLINYDRNREPFYVFNLKQLQQLIIKHV